MVIAEAVHRRLLVLVLAGSTLLTLRPVSAEPVVDRTSTVPGAAGRPKPTDTVSAADLRAIAGWMDEGRAALERNNPAGAIQIFTKILKYPENQYSAEAQEYLGLAHQKRGELGEARAEYEDYLRRYPNGEQSDRVRQRLAGVVTATGGPSAALRAPGELLVKGPVIGKFTPTRDTNWTLVGSASVFYIRDDAFTRTTDGSLVPNPNASTDDTAIHQNETLATLDMIATWNNDKTKGRIRFSGAEEHRFNSPTMTDETGIAALSVETLVKDWDLTAVAGRQTLNGDGVVARFDGLLLSWQRLPTVRIDLVGGSPQASRYDAPLKNDRYFYGTGVHFGPFFGGLETSLYAIEQRDRWLVDREAVGTDFRYIDLNKFAFGNIDYDVHFQALNAAVVSGSWTLTDKSTIYGGADYRRTPFLSTMNALLNSPFVSLYNLLAAQPQTNQQLQTLAINSTPIYKSAMVGFTHPISEKLEIGGDVTVVNLSQPIAQTGVSTALLATLPAGNEYYFSAQLIGSNLLKEGDQYIGALRFAQQPTLKEYVIDLNTRYPVSNNLLVSPRLRLGYTTGVGTDLKQYTVFPSFMVDYFLTQDLSFEAELGAQWTDATLAGVKTSDIEFLATIGVRYSFHAESGGGNAANDRRKLATPATTALCRYASRPDGGNGSNCMSPYAGNQAGNQ
jgi:hypothetical protein